MAVLLNFYCVGVKPMYDVMIIPNDLWMTYEIFLWLFLILWFLLDYFILLGYKIISSVFKNIKTSEKVREIANYNGFKILVYPCKCLCLRGKVE